MSKNQTPNRMRVVSSGREPQTVATEEISTDEAGPEDAAVNARSISALIPVVLFVAASAGGGIAASLWLAR